MMGHAEAVARGREAFGYRHPAAADFVNGPASVAEGESVRLDFGRCKMTKKMLYSAIAAAVGILGCAGAGTRAALPCNEGVCKVAVTIINCTAPRGVSVSLDPLPVDAPNNIVWEFATDGYSFPQNGVIIGPDPAGELGKPVVAPNGKKVTVHDKHNKTNYSIYYAVNVMKDDGTPCIPLDPWINNM
jgi:hypothetical protein